MHVQRCWQMLTEWWIAKEGWWFPVLNTCFITWWLNTQTHIHIHYPFISFFLCVVTSLSPPYVRHLWHHNIYHLSPLWPLTSKCVHSLLYSIFLCLFKNDFRFHKVKAVYKWNTAYIRHNQKHMKSRVKGFFYIYQQLTWVLLNVKAVKLLLDVMFYTLLEEYFSSDRARCSLTFSYIYFCKT